MLYIFETKAVSGLGNKLCNFDYKNLENSSYV